MTNPRLAHLTDYPFDRLRALLEGLPPPADIPPLALSIGEPQHPPPGSLRRVVDAHGNLWGRYPPIQGSEDLIDAIAGWLVRRYGLGRGDVDGGGAILPLSGTREGLFQIAQVVVGQGDAGAPPLALLPNPFYQVYAGAALMAGAEPLYLPATAETGFLPDFSALSDTVLARTEIAYLCSPSNPQGAVAGLDYLKAAVSLARRHDFLLVADECYADIYNTDSPPPGVLEACRDLGTGWKNVAVFHSLSKRSSAPGLRSGFVAGDAEVLALFRRLRNYGGAQVPGPLQAASAALWRDDAHAEANRVLYREKFAAVARLIDGRFGYSTPDAGFFLWLDVGDGEAAARRLWTEQAIRVLPGAYLAHGAGPADNPGHAYIRVALVHQPEIALDAINRLVKVLSTNA